MFEEKRLAGVERSVQIFEKETHALKAEIYIDIPLNELIKIVSPTDDDPLLYGFHKITNQQAFSIFQYTKEEFTMPEDSHLYYVLACFGLYE